MTPVVAVNGLAVRPGIHDGAATYTLNLLHHLPRVRPEVRFLAYVRAGEARIDPPPNLELRHVETVRAWQRVLWETRILGDELERAGAAALLSPHESVPRWSGPTIVVAQNLFYHSLPGVPEPHVGLGARGRAATRLRVAYYRRRMPRTYAHAAAVVVVSDYARRVLVEHAALDGRKASVVHEGADSVLLPPPRDRGARTPRLLSVASLAPHKGILRLVEVFARLRRERPQLRLCLAGGDFRGFERVVRHRVGELAIAPFVDFAGAVGTERLAELYDTSLLLVHVSQRESFGLPVAEAMRHGLPVVAADRAALPEVAGGAAKLVDADDVSATADSVRALVDDGAARSELAELGRRRAAELTWERTAVGVAEVLEGVLGGRLGYPRRG